MSELKEGDAAPAVDLPLDGGGQVTSAGLERRLVESQRAVRQIFDRLCPPGR